MLPVLFLGVFAISIFGTSLLGRWEYIYIEIVSSKGVTVKVSNKSKVNKDIKEI